MSQRTFDEILLFFMERWGSYAIGASFGEPFSQQEILSLTRKLEIEGSMLCHCHLETEMISNFGFWLEQHLPLYHQQGKYTSRLAFVFESDHPYVFETAFANKKILAKQYPVPMLFHFSSEKDWQNWIKEHTFLYGEDIELIRA